MNDAPTHLDGIETTYNRPGMTRVQFFFVPSSSLAPTFGRSCVAKAKLSQAAGGPDMVVEGMVCFNTCSVSVDVIPIWLWLSWLSYKLHLLFGQDAIFFSNNGCWEPTTNHVADRLLPVPESMVGIQSLSRYPIPSYVGWRWWSSYPIARCSLASEVITVKVLICAPNTSLFCPGPFVHVHAVQPS